MPTSEVILTENIKGLGAEADIVKVKRGYARNFLLPTGKAYEITPVTLKRLNGLKTKRAEREAAERNAAEELARRINKLTLHLTLETGATGKAFGSISVRDIEEALKKELPNATIERHSIQLEKPIKETGLQEIPSSFTLKSPPPSRCRSRAAANRPPPKPPPLPPKPPRARNRCPSTPVRRRRNPRCQRPLRSRQRALRNPGANRGRRTGNLRR